MPYVFSELFENWNYLNLGSYMLSIEIFVSFKFIRNLHIYIYIYIAHCLALKAICRVHST